MTHARAQLREAAIADLTGLPTTADRVFAGRTRPLAKDHEPTLLVYAVEETVEIEAFGAVLGRTLTLAVEGRVSAAAPPDDALDAIAAEVEAALLAKAGALLALARSVTLTATRINAQAPGEKHIGAIRLEFAVVYRTREPAPETILR